MAALVRDFDEQVAVRGIGHGHFGEVAEHGLHQHVLEPDAGAAQRSRFVAAVRDALGVRHGVPGIGAEQRQHLGREVVGGIVDRHRPVDGGEGIESRAFGGGDQLGGPMRRPGEGDGVGHVCTQTVTVGTVKIFLQYVL